MQISSVTDDYSCDGIFETQRVKCGMKPGEMYIICITV